MIKRSCPTKASPLQGNLQSRDGWQGVTGTAGASSHTAAAYA